MRPASEELPWVCVDLTMKKLICVDHIPSPPSVVQRRKTHAAQPLLIGFVPDNRYLSCGSALDPLNTTLISPVKGSPHQIAMFKVRAN